MKLDSHLSQIFNAILLCDKSGHGQSVFLTVSQRVHPSHGLQLTAQNKCLLTFDRLKPCSAVAVGGEVQPLQFSRARKRHPLTHKQPSNLFSRQNLQFQVQPSQELNLQDRYNIRLQVTATSIFPMTTFALPRLIQNLRL